MVLQKQSLRREHAMLSLRYRHPLEILQSERRTRQVQGDSLYETTWSPRVDISELEHAFVLEADLPGVGQSDLTIEVEEDLLTLRGKRQTSTIPEAKALRQERADGHFERVFRLSDRVSKSDIKADMKDGVLRLELLKIQPEAPKKVSVHFH